MGSGMPARLSIVSVAALAGVTVLGGCAQPPLTGLGRFIEEGIGIEADVDWQGESLTVEAAGTGDDRAAIAIGLDPTTTRVRLAARMVAVADVEAKAAADLTIEDAKNTLTIATAGRATAATCGHGLDRESTAGKSIGSLSGCERLSAFLPGGTPELPVAVAVTVERGSLTVVGSKAVLAEVELRAKNGNVEATLPTTKGSKIVILAEQGKSVTLRLPAAFAADAIELEAQGGRIDTTAFPDLQPGAGRGAPGEGATLISVRALPLADGTGGTILLTR